MKTHLATGDERLRAFPIPSSEARRNKIGDTSALLHECLGFGSREEFECELSSNKFQIVSPGYIWALRRTCSLRLGLTPKCLYIFCKSIEIGIIAACVVVRFSKSRLLDA